MTNESPRDERILDPHCGKCPKCLAPLRIGRVWTAVRCGSCGHVETAK
jgi:hypothetical protein